MGDLADAGGEVEETGDSGEEARNDGDDDKLRDVQHEPEHGGELGEGGDFPGPVRLDVAFADEMIDDEGSADASEITKDHEHGEPEGELLAPAGEAEGDDGGEQEQFVSEGVEDGSESAFLIEGAGDVAVQGIAEGGSGENGDGGPAQGLVGLPQGHAFTVVDRHADEDGDQ